MNLCCSGHFSLGDLYFSLCFPGNIHWTFVVCYFYWFSYKKNHLKQKLLGKVVAKLHDERTFVCSYIFKGQLENGGKKYGFCLEKLTLKYVKGAYTYIKVILVLLKQYCCKRILLYMCFQYYTLFYFRNIVTLFESLPYIFGKLGLWAVG